MPAATTAVPARPLTWGPHEVPVPYVVRWSSERVSARGVTVRADGSGLSYEDERPADRDAHGVLWAREPHTPGEGRPNYRSMHSSRQRSVVRTLSCQVCGGRADRNGQGWLFILPRTDADPEGSLCTKPPMCTPCSKLALRHCPHLADAIALRVRKPRVWGALGDVYVPTGPDRRVRCIPSHGYLAYGDAAAPWFLAAQLVLELRRVRRAALPHPSV